MKTKMIKMLTATMLTALLLFCGVIGAGAFSFKDVTQYKDAIELLSSVEIIKGYNTTQFGPNDAVNRWQMALLITKMVTGDCNSERWYKSSQSVKFTDVKVDHYMSSVAYAHTNGIIIGRSDTEFDPTAGITMQEALTMVIRALGYPRTTYDVNWPEKYIALGKQLKLTAGLESITNTAALTRGQTAQVLYNAMNVSKYSGGTFADSSFKINKTLVLTATSNMKISDSVNYAGSGMFYFSELNPDGTFGTNYQLPAASFSSVITTSSANNYIGMSFNVTASGDYKSIYKVTANKKTVYTSGLTVNTSGNTLTLNNSTYKAVSRYSYELKSGVSPSAREIIVMGVNSSFAAGNTLGASDIYSTMAHYSITVFDDNGDSYWDRALYKPYSFGQYNETASGIAIAQNKAKSQLTIIGAAPKSGDYVLYSYNSQSSTLEINKIFTISGGTVSSQSGSTVQIGLSTYSVGIENLPGATSSQVLATVGGTSLYGRTVSYVLDGTSVVAFATGSAATAANGAYYNNMAVVTEVNTATAATMQYITVKAYICDGVTVAREYFIKSVDGVEAYINGSTIAVGDVLELTPVYTTYPTKYTAKKLDSVPSFITQEQSSRLTVTYDNASQSGYVSLISGSGTTVASAAVNATTVVLFSDGVNVSRETLTSTYKRELTATYAMYISYGTTSQNVAKLIYIKPYSSSGGAQAAVGRIYTQNMAVIESVGAVSFVNGAYVVPLYVYKNGNTMLELMNASTVDGVPVSYGMNTGLAKGDLITYADNGMNRSVTRFISTPSYSTNSSIANLSYYQYLTLRLSNTTGTAALNISFNSDTLVLIFDGVTLNRELLGSSSGYTRMIPANYSIYVTGTLGTPQLIYIRPTVVSQGTSSVQSVTQGSPLYGNIAVVTQIGTVSTNQAGYSYIPYQTTAGLMNVTTVNGTQAAYTTTPIAVGDVVEYSQTGGFYSFITKNSAPSYSTNAATAVLQYYYSGALKLTQTGSASPLGTVSYDNSTRIVTFDGSGTPAISYITGSSYYRSLQAGYAVYVVYQNQTGGAANIIYIRPYSTAAVNPAAGGSVAVIASVGNSVSTNTTYGTYYLPATAYINTTGELVTFNITKINGVPVAASINSLAVGDIVTYTTENGMASVTIANSTPTVTLAAQGSVSYSNQYLSIIQGTTTVRSQYVNSATTVVLYDGASFSKTAASYYPTRSIPSGSMVYVITSGGQSYSAAQLVYIKTSSSSTGGNVGTAVSDSLCVVRSAPTKYSDYINISVYKNGTATETMKITSVNGIPAINATVSAGDIYKYTKLSDNSYSLTSFTNAAYTAGAAGATLAYKNSTSLKITEGGVEKASYMYNAQTTVIFSSGTSVTKETVSSGFSKSIPVGYSVYVTNGGTGTAQLIYISPTKAGITGSFSGEPFYGSTCVVKSVAKDLVQYVQNTSNYTGYDVIEATGYTDGISPTRLFITKLNGYSVNDTRYLINANDIIKYTTVGMANGVLIVEATIVTDVPTHIVDVAGDLSYSNSALNFTSGLTSIRISVNSSTLVVFLDRSKGDVLPQLMTGTSYNKTCGVGTKLYVSYTTTAAGYAKTVYIVPVA